MESASDLSGNLGPCMVFCSRTLGVPSVCGCSVRVAYGNGPVISTATGLGSVRSPSGCSRPTCWLGRRQFVQTLPLPRWGLPPATSSGDGFGNPIGGNAVAAGVSLGLAQLAMTWVVLFALWPLCPVSLAADRAEESPLGAWYGSGGAVGHRLDRAVLTLNLGYAFEEAL